MIYLLGISLSIISFLVGKFIVKNKYLKILPSVLWGSIFAIFILSVTKISYEDFEKGGKIVSYFLGPATVALAYPLSKFVNIIKMHYKIIICGVFISVFTNIFTIIVFSKIFNASDLLFKSILGKNVTMPIAIEIAKTLDGNIQLLICSVIIMGMGGATIGHWLLNKIGVKNNTAIGFAIGSCSHVIGTASCIEKNSHQASISTLSLILVGISTSIVVSLIF